VTDDLTIDGAAVHDIPSFYDEINRVFMSGESWRLGESLDALDDLLYGGYGALHGRSGARVVWTDHEASRRALGRETTIAYHRSKLERPGVFNAERARSAIADLEAGTGETYFEIVLAILADHPEIELVLA
jgi:RNAse (barnase) inhibitor barstar